MSRRVLSVWLAVTAAVVAAGPAAGARLQLVEASGAQFPDRAFVLTLPSDRPLRAGEVDVRENGNPVSGVSLVPAGDATSSQFGVVLVIDASDSMAGQPIAAAIQAAQRFVARRNPNEQVAIVTFNSTPRVALPFTTDSGKIVEALATPPPLAYGTHIYGAVAKAISLLGDAKIVAGSLVILSDGADTGSRITREKVSAAAARAHVRVFTVGLRGKGFDAGALKGLALAAHGRYAEASSPHQLAKIYGDLGTQLANEYLLTYRSLAGLGATVRVTVRVPGIAGSGVSGYATPPLQVVTKAPYHPSLGNRFWGSALTMVLLSVLVAFLLVLSLALLLVPRRRTLRRRLAQFVSLAHTEEKEPRGTLSKRILAEVEKPFEQTGWWSRFEEDVELAGIRFSPIQIAAWTFVGTGLVVLLFAVLFGLFALIVGLLLPFVVWAAIRRLVERKRALFAEQLPDNLTVLASAMRAGHSLVGALSVVVEDAPEPARSEFRRVVADERLGKPLDEALSVVVQRMRSDDLAQVALVAVLQRETGGNTAEVLDRVVETVRERQELRRLVRTLTAAGRLSRWVVSFLPVALIGAILVVSPNYLKPLFAHTSGRILVVLSGLMVITGSLIIKRIVDIEV